MKKIITYITSIVIVSIALISCSTSKVTSKTQDDSNEVTKTESAERKGKSNNESAKSSSKKMQPVPKKTVNLKDLK